MRSKFYTNKGKLSSYAFSCGYVESKFKLNLSLENGVYHIKGYTKKDSWVHTSFRTLTKARKFVRENTFYGRG